MTTGKTLHLSQLSRGVGEEYPKYSQFGHHKVNVYLEPQDYFNWVEKKPKKVIRLTPLPNVSKLSTVPQNNITAIPVGNKEIILPKTFTTRKGALFLFSENALGDTVEREDGKDQLARNEGQEEKQDGESLDIDLRTVGEFTKSILAYGNQHRKQNYIQLLTKIDNLQRQFRPGFSAKRYLSIWSKFWDHSTLDKLLKDGYIQSKSFFQMTRLSSWYSRSLDDLSSQPLPYRLVHTMLQSNLQGYTFFRVINNQDLTVENNFIHQPYGELKVFDSGSNKQDNGSQEIFYGQLDRCQQEQVLTDYLLQSTVHHAFKVHQLQSLLDAKAHQPVINLPNLPLNEVHPSSNHEFGTKNKKRKAFRAHNRKLEKNRNVFLPPLVQNSAEPGNSWSARPPSATRISRKDPETETFLPTISQKPCPQKSNLNPKISRMHILPFIQTPTNAVPAPPATAVDPDEDSVNFSDQLPLVPIVNIEPPTRQNSSIFGITAHRRTEKENEYKTSEVSDDDLWMSLVNDRISPAPMFWENKMEELSKNQETMEPEEANHLKTIEANAFSSLNISPTMSENTKALKTSHQSMAGNKSYTNHRKRPIKKRFMNVPDMKGSIIQAPGGEIVHIGGSLAYRKTVLPEISPIAKVSDKMEDELKKQQRNQSKERALSLLSAPKVVEMLTKNAYRMASFILDQDGTGKVLDDDIKMMTREVSRVLSSKNGVSLQDGNQKRMLHPEDNYTQTGRETASSISAVNADDKDQRLSSDMFGEQGLENVLVTHSLKGSNSPASQLTSPQNGIDGDALSGLLGGVKPGHLYQAAVRGSSPLSNASIPNQRNTVHTAIREMDVTTLQPAHHTESEHTDSARQTTADRSSSNESRNQVHFKSKEEEEFQDEDMLNSHILVRNLSQNLAPSPNSSDRRSSGDRLGIDEKGAPAQENDSKKEGAKEIPACAGVPSSLSEEGAGRNIIIKMPEVIQSEEYDQATSTEEPDTASIEEETHRAMEPYQKIIGNASPNQEATEASDRKRFCSPRPDSDPAEQPPFASNTSKRPTPGRSMSQNDANSKSVPKIKKGKNTPKEEFKVSRVDYAGELKRLYSRTEINKTKMADVKHGKSKPKERKTVKGKSKQSKKQNMSKKHKKKNKSTNKSLNEVDEYGDKSTTQWESEDQTTVSGIDSTGSQNIENIHKSMTDRNRSEKESDAISTWIQDASDKIASDVSDNEKGDNSESSEPAVPEMVEKDDNDEEKDKADEQTGEKSESEEQKKMMLELKRILTPSSKKTEDIPQSSETKSPEVAPYNMITSQEARAAERRARAAKRREQVERKRKEREEQLRREKEMAERQEKLRLELEEQRRLLEEERRLRKQHEEEERRRLEEEELAREVKRLQEIEAEKRKKNEHSRKLRLLKMQQMEEERKRQEILKRQREEEEARRKAEEEMLAQMAEQERIEYEKKRQEEEERRRREEEEKRIQQEAEAKLLMEEAIRLAQENAKRQAELEARFQFTQTLNSEAVGLTRCQAVTRAFVFSYFELLTLLGIENTDQQQQQQQQQQTLLGEIP